MKNRNFQTHTAVASTVSRQQWKQRTFNDVMFFFFEEKF